MAPLNQHTDLHVSAVTKFDKMQWLIVHHRPLDIEVMLGLHTKVNIIPVIAKVISVPHIYDKNYLRIILQADTFTAVERKQFKEKVGGSRRICKQIEMYLIDRIK